MNRSSSVGNLQRKPRSVRITDGDPLYHFKFFLCLISSAEKLSEKDGPRVVCCFYLGHAPQHPSGTVCIRTKSIILFLTTRYVTWLDMEDASLSAGNGGSIVPTNGGGDHGNIFCDREQERQT